MLEPDEVLFLRFHMTAPLPGAWQFVPNEVPPATFQAVKQHDDGRQEIAKLPITSFSKIERYFDSQYRVTEEGKALVGGEAVI